MHLHSGQLIGKPAGGSPLLTGRRAVGTPLLIGRWERKPLIGRQSDRRIPPSGHWSKEYKELVLMKGTKSHYFTQLFTIFNQKQLLFSQIRLITNRFLLAWGSENRATLGSFYATLNQIVIDQNIFCMLINCEYNLNSMC
jgi:hypothetical protein